MTVINVNEIKAGMVLAEDAVHNTGRVLLKAGSELNTHHIKIFKTWGIGTININSENDRQREISKSHSDEEIKRAISRQRQQFKYCDLNHPFTNELFRASIKASLEITDEDGP